MEIKKEIEDFKNKESVTDLDSFFNEKSFMEIYNIENKEIRHSAFFYWLFNENEKISKQAFKLLLELIVDNDKFSYNKNLKSYECFKNKKYEIQKVVVEKEYSGNKSSFTKRIDLYLEANIKINERTEKIKIFIENKIESKENGDQTIAYYKEFKKNNDSNIFIYLTPLNNYDLEKLKNIPECVCKEYIQLNYQMIVDDVLEPLLEIIESDRNKYIVQDYLKTLRISVKVNGKNTIMAITKKESELLKTFWNNNKKIILQAIEAVAIDPDVDPELQIELITAKESLDKLGIGEEVQNEFEQLCEKGISERVLKNIMNKQYSKDKLSIGYPLIIEKTNEINCGLDKREYLRYYKKRTYSINNKEYLLCNHWVKTNIENFRNWVKEMSN